MKKFAILAMLSIVGAANATVIYDNGAPNGLDGNEMTLWRQSEDIANNGTNVYNTLVFWTGAAGANLHDVDVQLSFDDGNGNPSTPVVDEQLTVNSVATGNLVAGFLTEYMNTVNLGDITASGNFTYHIALLGNYEEGAQQRDEVYWETTNPNGTNTGRESLNDLQNNWFDNGNEHAFRLEYNAVPEPASMAALGLGAIAMIRRRRAAK